MASPAHAPEAWSNISVHALNTPFALFEVLFTNTPAAPWITLPCGVIVLALYLGVAYITKADQGFYSACFSTTFVFLFNKYVRSHSLQIPESTHPTRAPCRVDYRYCRRLLHHISTSAWDRRHKAAAIH
jgi:hypothetical protein